MDAGRDAVSAEPIARCRACLGDLTKAEYHPRCARELFDSPRIPSVDLDLARLHTAGLAMVGRTSIPGVQRKISLRATGDRETLVLEAGAGRFILKPQAQTYPDLPENEHVSMRIARAFGIEVATGGLLRLRDGSIAFLTRRFDRKADGRKLQQEDFCQLARKPPKEKYAGSAELLFEVVREFASEPGIEALRLYRLLLVCWWVGNGDAHLKNFSLLRGDDGRHRLAPAYDVVNTRLAIENDPLALPIGGKQQNLTRQSWLGLADHARLQRRAAERELSRLRERLPAARDLVVRSFLPPDSKDRYEALLEERASIAAP